MLRIHSGLPKLIRIHLSQSFIALDLVVLIPPHFLKDLVQLLIAIGIPYLLVLFQLIKRGLRQIHISLLDQLRHKTVYEGKHQRSDVGAVHVRIRHDDDLVIPQLGDIEILMDPGAESRDHGLDLRVGKYLVQPRFFHVQNLSAQW